MKVKEHHKEYIKEQQNHLSLIGSNITPLHPHYGYFVTVDGLKISQDVFPEEFKTIQEMWHSVSKKLKQ